MGKVCLVVEWFALPLPQCLIRHYNTSSSNEYRCFSLSVVKHVLGVASSLRSGKPWGSVKSDADSAR